MLTPHLSTHVCRPVLKKKSYRDMQWRSQNYCPGGKGLGSICTKGTAIVAGFFCLFFVLFCGGGGGGAALSTVLDQCTYNN